MQNGHRTWALQENSVAATILVIDDDDVCRGSLADLLKGNGYAVVEAASRDQAQAILEQPRSPISLIVSDVVMPGGSGIEMLAFVRHLHPDIPVLLVTGDPSISSAVNAMQSGAIGYLPKPVDAAKLFSLVQEAISLHKRNQVNWRLAFANHQGPEGYIVERQIGEGTYGDVFLVHQDGMPYALKTIRTFGVSKNQQAIIRQRFLHECQVLKVLRHPNIITFYEYGMVGESQIPYLVMEYLPGDSWKNLLARSLRLRLELLLQAARGLQAIHQAGFCHRDIKPSNLLINCARKTVKWSDFGLIRLPESTITLAGQTIGSPAYMAPEAFLSSRFDFRADIFSLGVLAYELFTGELAFDGKSLAQQMEATLHQHPADPQEVNPDIPTALQRSLSRMLQKDPEQRPASLQETISEWEACLEGDWTRHRVQVSLKNRLLSMTTGRLAHPPAGNPPPWMSPNQTP